MKFCPKCGAKLPDEAVFCSYCGSKQPETSVKEEVAAPEPAAIEIPIPEPQAAVDKSKSPSQRYNDLVKNDPLFREIVQTRRKKFLFELIFILFLVSWAVCLFTPVASYTGKNATDYGTAILQTKWPHFPIDPADISAFDLINLKNWAGRAALAPGSLSSVFAVMTLIIGLILGVLSIAMPLIKAFTGRGYVLKTYEEGKKKELIKDTVRPAFQGAIFALFPLAAPLNLYLGSIDLTYKEGDTYIYGEIEGLKEGFITTLIVALLVAAALIVVSVVVGNVFTRRLKEEAKKL